MKQAYIDSNIFIYVLDGRSPFSASAAAVLTKLNRTITGISSVVSYGEALRPGKIIGTELAAAIFLESLPALRLIPVDPATAKHAGQLRLEHGLSLADAIHVATALATGADLFVTNDLPLTKKIRSLIPVENLKA